MKLSDNLTQHFTLLEFNREQLKLDSVKIYNLLQMAIFLEGIRAQYGHPIIITSGVRSPEHNKRVGGLSNSSHLLAKAVDITVKNSRANDFQKLAFLVAKNMPPQVKYYYEIHPRQRYIHIQFGEKNEAALNLLHYYPFIPSDYDPNNDQTEKLPF